MPLTWKTDSVESEEEVVRRIEKDIAIFSDNIKQIRMDELSGEERKIVELAEMYAKDSRAFLSKDQRYTAFASIAYAHGLLDSIRKLKNLME